MFPPKDVQKNSREVYGSLAFPKNPREEMALVTNPARGPPRVNALYNDFSATLD